MGWLEGATAAVIGGAGFIGSHLVDRLIHESPKKLVVVDNLSIGTLRNLQWALENQGGIKIYHEDASDPIVMQNIFEREHVDIVFNLAVRPLPYSFDDPEGAYFTPVGVTRVLLHLLRRKHFGVLVHFSSSEVYGTAQYTPMDESHPISPHTPYAAGKASADLLCLSYRKTFDAPIAILRPFNTYGPRQNSSSYAALIPQTITRILSGLPPIIESSGDQTRDFTYVQDIVAACVELAKRMTASKGFSHDVINVGSGKEYKVTDIVERMCKIAGYSGAIEHRPPRVADVQRHVASIDLATKVLGYRPQTDLDEGLRLTVEWYRKERTTARNHGLHDGK